MLTASNQSTSAHFDLPNYFCPPFHCRDLEVRLVRFGRSVELTSNKLYDLPRSNTVSDLWSWVVHCTYDPPRVAVATYPMRLSRRRYRRTSKQHPLPIRMNTAFYIQDTPHFYLGTYLPTVCYLACDASHDSGTQDICFCFCFCFCFCLPSLKAERLTSLQETHVPINHRQLGRSTPP